MRDSHGAPQGPRACFALTSSGRESQPFPSQHKPDSHSTGLPPEKWAVPKLGQLGQLGRRAVRGRHPGWSCRIVLSWPTPGRKMTQTRTHLGAGWCVWGPQMPPLHPLLHQGVVSSGKMGTQRFRGAGVAQGHSSMSEPLPAHPWSSPRSPDCVLQLPRGCSRTPRGRQGHRFPSRGSKTRIACRPLF